MNECRRLDYLYHSPIYAHEIVFPPCSPFTTWNKLILSLNQAAKQTWWLQIEGCVTKKSNSGANVFVKLVHNEFTNTCKSTRQAKTQYNISSAGRVALTRLTGLIATPAYYQIQVRSAFVSLRTLWNLQCFATVTQPSFFDSWEPPECTATGFW